jgi:hypothetical protein
MRDEIAILAKEAGFDDVSEDNLVELLESYALPLINEELAELDRQTYRAEQDGHNDERVISEENSITIESFKRNLVEN